MKDEKKTKKELMEELAALKKQLRGLSRLQEKQKALEESPKNPSERYRAAVELSNDPAVIVGKGRRLFANQELIQFLGYDKPEELQDKPLYFAVHPDDVSKARALVSMRQEGKEAPSRYELRLVRKDHSIVHAEASASLISYEGEPASLVYFRDVSERKQAEAALVKSERNFRTVIENIQDVFYRSDREGRLILGSPSGTRIFGYDSCEEMIGLPLESFWFDLEERKRFLGEMREKRSVKDFDAVFKKKDGTLFNASLTTHVYYDENETSLGTEGIIRDITERKRAESMYRTLAERSFAGVYVVQNGKFQYLNANAAFFAGYTAEELVGKQWRIIVHPDDLEKVRQCVRRMLSGKRLTPYEFRVVTKEGDVRWIMETVSQIDYDGKKAILGNSMDITEVKRIQDTLRQSEQEKAHILGAMTELVFYLDTDLRIISVNAAAARLFNLSLEQMQERYCYEVLHGREEPCHVCPALKALQTGEPQTVYNFHSYGRWWILRGHPVWSDERMIGVVEIVTDITERKMAEDALRESEEKYRLLVENAGDAIFIVQDGLIRFGNPMISRISGYALEEIMDRPFVGFVHPDDRLRLLDIHERRMRGEKVTDCYELRGLAKDGSVRWLEGNAVLIDWQGRPATLTFMRDITAQKTLESQLRQSQKLEALGTLAGGIAHDFNNLLSGILGHASLLEMDYETTGRQRERLDGIKNLVKSASSLTSQLLGFARLGRYEVMAIDINELLEKTATLFGRTRKEIVLQKRLADDLMPVEADRTQWEQVFMNLFVNAWQAMPGGGVITIETSNVITRRDDPQLTYIKPGSYVKISVSDAGVGMDEATRRRIFEPFFTTKEMGRGTGLGLATVYGIVKGHGGYIDVHSTKGHGTTFDIYLPASEKQLARETEEAREDLARGSETVLLIDDEEQIVEVIGDVLQTLGYTIFSARNGQEAIEIYREKKDKIDLVILDLIMPGMSGGETFERLKEINGEVMVILSSGYSLGGQAGEVMEKGCRAFIQKPFNAAELSQKVREVLDRS